jgi:hypothetical protein
VGFLIEVVVHRAVDGGEFLERLHPSEPDYRPFSSTEGKLGILSAFVLPSPLFLPIGGADLLQRSAIRSKPVGYDSARPAMALHSFLDELQLGG